MTLNELISKLSELRNTDPRVGEMNVKFASPAGDYWHNTLALDTDTIEFSVVRYSGYHDSDKVIETYDDLCNVPETGTEENVVVLIS